MNEEALSRMYLQDTAFQHLMQRRIFNVLLIASRYDAFMMEEDGRVEEQLYNEYVSLNLSSPPRVTRVSNFDEALKALSDKSFDLVLIMPAGDISQAAEGCRSIKETHPAVPIVLLTPFSKEVTRRLEHEDLSAVDYVFSWLGNMDLLLAIIKLLEDKLNQQDITGVGVQVIMLVEDSVRFYSSILPHVYKFLLKQSRNFSTEALNQHEQMLRMRGRPKVMLARNYEEATDLYRRYGKNMLGVISDVSFMRNGQKDRKAGLRLAKFLRESDPSLPVIIESSETENREGATALGAVFVDKNSKKLSVDLEDAIMGNFGFGDFIIRNPATGEEIMRITNLKDMQKRVWDIPAESLLWHASTNDISRWFYSRALFPIADVIRRHRFASLEEVPAARQLFFDLIVKYRFDHYSNFARIGQGSLGGKGRGLAFIDSIIKKNPICDNFQGLTVSIPRTVVLCTDLFDEFMLTNRLYPLALSPEASDDEILDAFLRGNLPERLKEDLLALFEVLDRPVAVRSSSLLEDSHYQPFAGIYSTYMVPYTPDRELRLSLLEQAVKGVYASVFYRDSKAYMSATSNVIDQEKMAVIIQEVIGADHGDYYFPSFSGVGRSLNYYPLGNEEPEDGVAEVAVGLGKYIVDGGRGLRFSPLHPEHVLQTSTLESTLRDTQTSLLALRRDPSAESNRPVVDDGYNLRRLSIQEFAGTDALKWTVSTYNAQDGYIDDCDCGRGRRVVTFANILRDKALPLAPAINFILRQGEAAMQRPIEIEFAGNILPATSPEGIKGNLYWLQIRPIIDKKQLVADKVFDRDDADLIVRSATALGHGMVENVSAVVYVRPENFDHLRNREIPPLLDRINREFASRGEGYVLIGMGRWGSSDPSLGIPVKWPEISAARVIVETTLPGYRIEPSQGTHFFQNLTSFGVGYFTVDPAGGAGYIDLGYLDSLDAEYEDEFIRIVRFGSPLSIAINGRLGKGQILKPDTDLKS